MDQIPYTVTEIANGILIIFSAGVIFLFSNAFLPVIWSNEQRVHPFLLPLMLRENVERERKRRNNGMHDKNKNKEAINLAFFLPLCTLPNN